jgi:uncharacterized membrane protein YbhN (UPF0104 family)
LRLPSIEWAAISAAACLSAVFAVSVALVGFDTLTANLSKLGSFTLGICLLLVAWQLGCRFLRWFFYARCLGLKMSLPEAFLYYGAGLGMTLTPARLGEVLRLWFLEQRFAAPYWRTAGLYLADRASDAVSYLILFAVGSTAYTTGASITWGALLLVVTVVLAIMHPRPIFALLNAGYAAFGQGGRLVPWLRRAIRNASTLFQPAVFLPGVCIGTIGWLGPPGVLTLSLTQMGVAFGLLQAVAVYAVAALTGGSTMVPGGIGTTNVALIGLLVASNVPLDAAVSAAIITRVASLWLPVGLGLLLLPVAMRVVGTMGRG